MANRSDDGGSRSDPEANSLLLRAVSASDVVSTTDAASASPFSLVADDRVRLAASKLVLTERAKLDLVGGQIQTFVEGVGVKLRRKVVEASLKEQEERQAQEEPWLTSTDRAKMAGAFALAAAPPSLGLAPRSAFARTLSRTASLLIFMDVAQSFVEKLQTAWVASERACLVEQFTGGASSEPDIAADRAVRSVSAAVAWRHVSQIVPLTKASQLSLAQVAVRRITRHLRRSRQEAEEESLAPAVAAAQRCFWLLQETADANFRPNDFRRTPRTKLSLHDRCIRALACESDPKDEVWLERDPFFASVAPSSKPWSAAGCLSRTGLRVEMDGKELYYGNKGTEHEVYGFAYGSAREVKERRMKPVDRGRLGGEEAHLPAVSRI